ncbi:MAG: ATP-dependent protease ATPase subunit HslU [Spirochaetia bacterium]|nr:ATP-dependent protease ATPase subunit HslU [Spirochaetota bacterium]MCX8096576.1 ATP-dependent protease ATPase subunit HslU [Spirochaetota bacterium]MDW8112870.1 ATP-dependent protease ATPase subunit HslU [Spirochaetia bacterium]
MDRLGLTPRELVEELSKYIIGQYEAKKAVAIALRNRNRRKSLPEGVKEDIIPKNILMIGPTGVGKTEIARRMALIINAPFVKVEATKFTEIGYIGRNVESMVRDLMNISYAIVKKEMISKNMDKYGKKTIEMIYKYLVKANPNLIELDKSEVVDQIKKGIYDDIVIEIELEELPKTDNVMTLEEMIETGNFGSLIEMQNPFEMLFGTKDKKRKKKVKVRDAKVILSSIESEKSLNPSDIAEEAKRRAEEEGIIFIDEIDKLITKGETIGPSVSREGVQRDLLPIVEGSTVNTKYGPIKTDHILFIAAGAFSKTKPSELIPELQGRFPVRVELQPLSKDDLKRILVEPKNALVKQYKLLLQTEGVEIMFDDSAIDRIAELAYEANQKLENIGARRLYTIMEKLLEDILFEAPDLKEKTVVIDVKTVNNKLSNIVANEDLAKYVL